jgi:hypothetical protein
VFTRPWHHHLAGGVDRLPSAKLPPHVLRRVDRDNVCSINGNGAGIDNAVARRQPVTKCPLVMTSDTWRGA